MRVACLILFLSRYKARLVEVKSWPRKVIAFFVEASYVSCNLLSLVMMSSDEITF
jgi:hypothetical protein